MLKIFNALTEEGDQKKVAFDPNMIKIIEKIDRDICNVVLENGIEYTILYPFDKLHSISNLVKSGFFLGEN